MKKSIAALALVLTLAGTLASCGSRDLNNDYNTGRTGNPNGVTSGSAAAPGNATSGASGTAGTVSRRYGGETTYNTYNTYNTGKYFDDGRYTAGPNGRVYDRNAASRDLTQDARDMVRDAGDAIGDVGRGIGNAARDITGIDSASGAPSWEPDSSAVRY